MAFDGYVADKGLLWKTRNGPSCLNPRSVMRHTGRKKELTIAESAGARCHNETNGSVISSLNPASTMGPKNTQPNRFFQIDKADIVKKIQQRKEHSRSWLVGGIDTTSKEVFREISPTRELLHWMEL
ncbi:unnamed protein product [Heligmosomoides polygyrus]|uniref:Transposase n=1 Tax=Heligmosomoides polygyrus TaxID=6339 RepID=A0A183F7M4_HELPZ|nr:unnamed protein product [Heligmosomoides polygyrus]